MYVDFDLFEELESYSDEFLHYFFAIDTFFFLFFFFFFFFFFFCIFPVGDGCRQDVLGGLKGAFDYLSFGYNQDEEIKISLIEEMKNILMSVACVLLHRASFLRGLSIFILMKGTFHMRL